MSKSVYDCIETFEGWINYLEKKDNTDLGDMTDAGKKRNAGSKNYTLYADWFKLYTGKNFQGQAYCAMAVSDALAKAYGYDNAICLLGGSLYYNCEDFYQLTKKTHPDRLKEKPEVGDIVLFYNGKRHNHTGFVTKVTTGGFVTVEANTSSGNDVVVPNGGATTRKSYTLSKTNADFYRPPYEDYGISLKKNTSADIVSYPISTGTDGLLVTASSLRVRETPSTSANQVASLATGDMIYPDKKAFDDRGVRWYHIESGWVSGNYLTGWIQEANGAWWYLLNGGKWCVNEIKAIDGCCYAFDAAGYMITEPITAEPDENGVLVLK